MTRCIKTIQTCISSSWLSSLSSRTCAVCLSRFLISFSILCSHYMCPFQRTVPSNSNPLNISLDLGSITPVVSGDRHIQLRRMRTDSWKADATHNTDMAPLLLKAQPHARIKQRAQVQYSNYFSLNNLGQHFQGPLGVRCPFPIKIN